MSPVPPLEQKYQSYIAAINNRSYSDIHPFLRPTIIYNNSPMTSTQYVDMIKRIQEQYNNRTVFVPELLVVDSNKGTIGCRVLLEDREGARLGEENVFYACVEEKIERVWSMVQMHVGE